MEEGSKGRVCEGQWLIGKKLEREMSCTSNF